jgi:membrane carboxypeptidase/penicillin-binding protein
MHKITVTYDTGDSFHQEHDLKHDLELTWGNLDKAKQALKDIEEHYHFYMIMHKEWNVDKKDQEKAEKKAKKMKWYDKEYSDFNIWLENDNGERVQEHVCWTGYFESLVGADIVTNSSDTSFRI